MSSNEWREVKLGEIVDIEMGQSPKSEFYNTEGLGVPFLQGNKTFGMIYPKFDVFCTNVKKIAI
jgi:type I restriction enzyme S subunit